MSHWLVIIIVSAILNCMIQTVSFYVDCLTHSYTERLGIHCQSSDIKIRCHGN